RSARRPGSPSPAPRSTPPRGRPPGGDSGPAGAPSTDRWRAPRAARARSGRDPGARLTLARAGTEAPRGPRTRPGAALTPPAALPIIDAFHGPARAWPTCLGSPALTGKETDGCRDR